MLAPVAGHPYDIALTVFSQRLYYQWGALDLKYFPTLPMLYYIQLSFYSIYVGLRALGLPDALLLYHTSLMIEGVFLKVPMILADAGVFFVLLRVTRKTLPAALYFLNPLAIFLSGAWGTYDSLMLLPLAAGFHLLQQDKRKPAALAFVVSGAIKLFGFIPFGFVATETLLKRRFKEFAFQVVVACSVLLVEFAPVAIQGGIQSFISGFVLRFVGFSGAQTRTWNIFSSLQAARFRGASPYITVAMISVLILFVIQSKKAPSVLVPTVRWSLVAAILLNIFSQSEPQWLSWIIPLSLIYASLTNRSGLGYFSFYFGTAATFLIITLTQGSGYVLTGVPIDFLGTLEGYYDALAVYAVTVLALMLLVAGYVFTKPVRFRLEVIALMIIIYVQAYFWFTIVKVLSL